MRLARTVAEQVVEVLEQADVKRIYGVVGDSLNPIVDAVRRSDRIQWVHVRNEEAGAFAAAAEAQLTGRLAVCAGSAGPGNTHLLQGLYDAQRSGAAVLALASHIPSRQIGTGYFQETHPERTMVDCSSYCELVNHPSQLPRVMQEAVQTALGRRAVSVVVLPGDIAQQGVAHRTGQIRFVNQVPPAPAAPEQVTALAKALNEAERVTFFCGAGVEGAHAEVMALAGKLLAPVGHTFRGKEWIQFDNPYDVGMSGLLGYGACYRAMHEADRLLLLGTDFPYDEFLPQARTIQIERDPARLGRRTKLELGVLGDVRATIQAVLPLVKQKTDRSFLDRMLEHQVRALEHVINAYTHDIDHFVPIHPEYAARILDEVAAGDAIFTVDTGMNDVWAARYITPNGRRRVIGSFVHGSMANALPHAIGAQLAYPGRQVVSMSGDGGLGMLLGELLTVKMLELPIKIVVFNNSALGLVKLEMMENGYPDFGTNHAPVDYAAIAKAIGLGSVRIEQPHDIRDGLRQALSQDEPVLIDLVTDPNTLSMPPHITASEVTGFTVAGAKIVLAGGVGKMLEMARANLRNVPVPT